MNTYLLSLLGGFLCGSIPTGYLVAKTKRLDIRQHGSGNIGATNVARALGKKYGAAVLVIDIVKGFVPSYLASQIGFVCGIFAGVGAVAGHTFTPYLKFRGGRGVATALGSVLGLMPLAGLACLVTWLVVLALARYVSLASICGALMLLLWVYGAGRVSGPLSKPRLALALVISVTVLIRHIPNMKRLLRRREPKFHL
jgi:glycerol-3-phosphate acyltransferase PlsY